MNHTFRRAFLQWRYKDHHLATVIGNRIKDPITTTKFVNVRNISKQTKCLSPFDIQSQPFGYGAKIEDYKQTTHGAFFSKWKILIGSNDWEDFKNGRAGENRYRVHDLPSKCCAGLYELGVAVIGEDQGREIDPYGILTAYIGHSICVRCRLQEYGCSGAHLHYVNNIGDYKKPLFEDIFLKQGSILYRLAQMGTKREAEAAEAMCLCTYDYAWNVRNNGERRHLELLKKLGDGEFMSLRKVSCDVDQTD